MSTRRKVNIWKGILPSLNEQEKKMGTFFSNLYTTVPKLVCYCLVFLVHLVVVVCLHFGVSSRKDDPSPWDLSNITATSAMWVYVAVIRSCLKWRKHPHLIRNLNTLAVTLPSISVTLSIVGIVFVLLWSDLVSYRDKLYMIGLYFLNIFCIILTAWELGLWAASKQATLHLLGDYHFTSEPLSNKKEEKKEDDASEEDGGGQHHPINRQLSLAG